MNTREIALVSIFSAVWVVSQVLVGPVAHTSTLHGLVQRFMGWFLMLVLAELTNRFGRVSLMATIGAFATRMLRYSAALYIWTVGLGYALGGVAFDALFFLPRSDRIRGTSRTIYLVIASLLSGMVAIVPYTLYRLVSIGPTAFLFWLPGYVSREAVNIGLNVLGTLMATVIVPRAKIALPILNESKGKPRTHVRESS